MGSQSKRLKTSAHQNTGREDAERLNAFLLKTPEEPGKKLVVGVLSQAVADETRKHLRDDVKHRVRFEVVKGLPPGIPGFKQTGGRVHRDLPVQGRIK